MKKRRSRQRGFTLIEILITLTILGIVAAIVGTNLWSARDTALLEAARLGLNQTAQGVEIFRLTTQRYPTTDEGLAILAQPPKGQPIEVPLVDPWNQPLRYVYPHPQKPGRFDLWSVGPDGADGTGDDVRREK